MKASRAQIERSLAASPPDVRFFLLYGPDESQSRELAARLDKASERTDLSGAILKADPARLADEAGAMSLFGGTRHIRVEPAGDEVYDAVAALLEAPGGGNPVVIVAGALRKDSKLLKRALAEPGALVFASYLPEGNDADRLASAIAREHGLRLEPDVARRLATSTGGDRALIAREIEKLALFVDAAPERPAELDAETFDALSVDGGDGDLSRLVDASLVGRGEQVIGEIARLAVDGTEGIALLRPVLRRLLLLAQLRAQVDRGDAVEAVMAGAGRAVFWKDKAAVSNQLARWSAEALATAIGRVADAESAVKASGSPGAVLVEAEMLTIARAAARMR